MSETWTFDAPAGVFKNAAVVEAMYEAARRPSAFAGMFPATPPPSLWRRLSWWLADYWPTFHLGPCDHEECD